MVAVGSLLRWQRRVEVVEAAVREHARVVHKVVVVRLGVEPGRLHEMHVRGVGAPAGGRGRRVGPLYALLRGTRLLKHLRGRTVHARLHLRWTVLLDRRHVRRTVLLDVRVDYWLRLLLRLLRLRLEVIVLGRSCKFKIFQIIYCFYE